MTEYGEMLRNDFGDRFRGHLGLSHRNPHHAAMHTFYDKMSVCSLGDFDRKWFKNFDRRLVFMSGDDFVVEFGPDGEFTAVGLVPVLFMLAEGENKIYEKRLDRWRGISSLELVHESFLIYVVDIDNRHVLIMDPCETSELVHEMKAKHERLATKIIKNLCIHDHFVGWVGPSHGWKFDYKLGMHYNSEREMSGFYIVNYLGKFTGTILRARLAESQLENLRNSIAYQVILMKGNRGDLPNFMYLEIIP